MSITAAEVSPAELGMAGAEFPSTAAADVSLAGLAIASAEAACASHAARLNRVETCSSRVCSCADSTSPLPITCTIIPATCRMSSGAMPLSNPGWRTMASSSSLKEQSLPTHEVESLHVEVICQMRAHQFLCVPKVPPVGLPTRREHEEQRPYDGFGEPAAVNIRFEPCQLLRQILAMLGRLAGTGVAAVHRRAGSVQSWPAPAAGCTASNACA